MVVVPVCLSGRFYSSECVGVVSYQQRLKRWISASPSLQFFWNVQRKSVCPIRCLLWGGTLPGAI